MPQHRKQKVLFLEETPKTTKSSIPKFLDYILQNLYLKFVAVMKYLPKEWDGLTV